MRMADRYQSGERLWLLTGWYPGAGFLAPRGRGVGAGVIGLGHLRWSYRASHAHAWSVSLPVVVAHERHRGGNSTLLDIPVAVAGDRSGPVTEVAGGVGVTVHQLPTSWADPHPVSKPEVGVVAAAAVVGLGGGQPAVGNHQFELSWD